MGRTGAISSLNIWVGVTGQTTLVWTFLWVCPVEPEAEVSAGTAEGQPGPEVAGGARGPCRDGALWQPRGGQAVSLGGGTEATDWRHRLPQVQAVPSAPCRLPVRPLPVLSSALGSRHLLISTSSPHGFSSVSYQDICRWIQGLSGEPGGLITRPSITAVQTYPGGGHTHRFVG